MKILYLQLFVLSYGIIRFALKFLFLPAKKRYWEFYTFKAPLRPTSFTLLLETDHIFDNQRRGIINYYCLKR